MKISESNLEIGSTRARNWRSIEIRRNSMKMKFLFVLTLVFVMSSFAFAQSPAGKWTGEMPGGRGGANPVVFEFTVAGTTLTGTITVGAGMATPITAGTIAGDTITFQAPAGGGGGGGRGGAPG